ncbi:TPA: P22AR C-terminal domain-containing protein [Yersinia enterocolitica]
MQHQNSEALTTCNSQGLDLSATLSESTDMKSIANNQLTFHSTTFSYMEMAGQIWLTAAEVGQALEYADDKAIHRIFNRHSDEFTTQMTGVVRATTPGGMQDVRVFSLRGAHLIGMFARTAKDKEFRRWVLDVLDSQISTFPVPEKRQFTDEELCTLCWLWRNAVSMISNSADVYPILRAAEHRLAGSVYSAAHEYPRNTNKVRALLERETAHIKAGPFTDDNWRVLNRLRVGQLLN